jgi:Ca2+-binding RTX toxin-like protein
LRIAGTSDDLRLHWWFLDGFGYTYQVQEARFADGTVWSLGTLQQLVLQGTTGPDVLNGYDTADKMNGFAGNDALHGWGGDDRLDGGSGADTMQGGAANDTYVVDNSADVVTEVVGAGTDTVLSLISYILRDNVENLALTGSAAINGTGNGLANALTGNSGANVLDGAAGADKMTGGGGNDTYMVDNTGDRVVESSGQGTDTVLSGVSYTLGANVENLTLTGTAAINGTGNSLKNVLVGNAATNLLSGGTGADTMRGGPGNDTYVVDNPGDIVAELAGEGTDTVRASIGYTLGANLENVVLTGTGAVGAVGNALANALTGNSAPNSLSGGGGADLLAGGAGADAYYYGRSGGADRILESDPTPGIQDRLYFDPGIQPLDIILSRSGNDLLLAVGTGGDVIAVQGWYQGPAAQVEVVQAGDGRRLAAGQADQLIQAMASYSAVSGLSWANAVTQRPAEVEAVLAAYWQTPTPGT